MAGPSQKIKRGEGLLSRLLKGAEALSYAHAFLAALFRQYHTT